MTPSPQSKQLIQYLRSELEIPADAIAFGLRRDEPANLLPMVLWQYGLLTLEQLEQVWDWTDQNQGSLG
jgi:hypothetical protein